MIARPHQREAPTVADSACRRCRVYCEWVVDPGACVERSCPNLYAYDDAEGRRIVGCLERVFAAELDLEVLDEVRRSRGGSFGAIRAARRPLPLCASSVERAYVHRAPAIGCVNPEFAEPVDRPAFRVWVRLRP